MTTFTISANSLEKSCCLARYRYYKILGRRAAGASPGLIAGKCLHAALAVMHQPGKALDCAAQEAALEAEFNLQPTPPDDYRTLPYLKDALAAFRAEWAPQLAGWTIEEVEAQGSVELGVARLAERHVQVLWEFRRDLVGVGPDGLRYLTDWKTMSRDEEAAVLSYQNAGQFMGYVWAWQQQNPGKPIHGVLVRRLVLRKPSKSGVAFSFPVDKPILFDPEKVEEWRRQTLRRVRDILERNPEDPDDWPQAATEVGLCRHQWGCCQYLPVCTQPPKDRALRLAMDDFEDATRRDDPAPATNGD